MSPKTVANSNNNISLIDFTQSCKRNNVYQYPHNPQEIAIFNIKGYKLLHKKMAKPDQGF